MSYVAWAVELEFSKDIYLNVIYDLTSLCLRRRHESTWLQAHWSALYCSVMHTLPLCLAFVSFHPHGSRAKCNIRVMPLISRNNRDYPLFFQLVSPVLPERVIRSKSCESGIIAGDSSRSVCWKRIDRAYMIQQDPNFDDECGANVTLAVEPGYVIGHWPVIWFCYATISLTETYTKFNDNHRSLDFNQRKSLYRIIHWQALEQGTYLVCYPWWTSEIDHQFYTGRFREARIVMHGQEN